MFLSLKYFYSISFIEVYSKYRQLQLVHRVKPLHDGPIMCNGEIFNVFTQIVVLFSENFSFEFPITIQGTAVQKQ